MREPLRTRTGVVVFGIMGGLMAAYLVWLIVDAPQSLQAGWLNGWVGTGFRLAAAVICLIGGVRRRPGSLVPLVFGSALLFTTIGNIILTVDSRHGPPPPPPTPADFFGLGTIVLCFVGIGLMARHDRGSLSPRESLDGAIAAMGAGAVCAAFLLAHLPHGPGLSTEGAADLLAYPIGYVVLVLIVVGAATVAGKRSRVPWEALTAAFALLALGSALGSTAVGHSEAVQILTEIQWPAATLLIAASMWADPGVPDPLAVRRGIVVWLPALACAATIVVLLPRRSTPSAMWRPHSPRPRSSWSCCGHIASCARRSQRASEPRWICGRAKPGTGGSPSSSPRSIASPPSSPTVPPPVSCLRQWPRRSAAPSRTWRSPWSAGTLPMPPSSTSVLGRKAVTPPT